MTHLSGICVGHDGNTAYGTHHLACLIQYNLRTEHAFLVRHVWGHNKVLLQIIILISRVEFHTELVLCLVVCLLIDHLLTM